MENEILNQLIWIKWLLATVVVTFAVGAVALALLARMLSKIPEQIRSDVSFPDRAKALLDEGKPEEVIGLAEKRISKFPADGYAHWYLGQACYRIGDLRRALICLRKTQDLQPEWESSYTGPLILVIEKKLAESSVKPELKVVTPDPAFERDQP